MDVDIPEETGQSSTHYARRTQLVVVDDLHPFELDGYIANYTGKLGADAFLVFLLSYLHILRAHCGRPSRPYHFDMPLPRAGSFPTRGAAHPSVARPIVVPASNVRVRPGQWRVGDATPQRVGPCIT